MWALAALAVLALASSASAQPLQVLGDDGCVTERSLRAAMARYAGKRKLDDSLQARVLVADGAMSFAVISGEDELAERDFERVPKKCAARVRALAIALVLAFENVHAEREAIAASGAQSAGRDAGAQEPANASASAGAASGEAVKPAQRAEPAQAAPVATPAPTATPNAEPKPVAPPQDAAADAGDQATESDAPDDDEELEPEPEDDAPSVSASSAQHSVVLQAGAGVLLGVLPKPALLLRAGVQLALSRHFALDLGLLASPGTTSTLGAGEVDTQLYAARAALCAGVPVGVLRASACLGAVGGAVRAQGRDYPLQSASTGAAWIAAVAGIALDVPLVGPLWLRASGDLLAAAVRPRLRVVTDGRSTDETASTLEALTTLQLLWALP